jgi:hypothetical protein
MTGLPPSELGAIHVRPTVPDAVTAALLANVRGAVGREAALIETSLEKLVLYPNAFLDSTLNLYTVFGIRVVVVE